MPDVKCQCGNEIVKSYGKGVEKIRAKIIVIRDGKAFAKCKKCNKMTEIPYGAILEKSDPMKVLYHVIKFDAAKVEKILST